MYLNFCVLSVLLIATSVESFSSCDRSRWNSANNMFNRLANDLMDLDKKVQDTCKQFPSFATREVFGSNSYRIEVSLPDFGSATFVIQIKHRVIYINAHYPREGKTCDLTYVDIKVLPEFVNTHGAGWTYNNGVLIVGFPYAHRIGDYDSYCSSQYVDETLILPHRGFPNERIFLD